MPSMQLPFLQGDEELSDRDNDYADNPNTTQTLEYTKDKYNAKIIKRRVLPKVPPTTYKGRRIK
jgi:hypothetical protein